MKMNEEYVYHVDEEDNVIGKVTRKEQVEKNLLHRTTGILTFNSQGEILVHKRTMTKDKFPGYYDMLNGGVVTYGESYDECANREIKEELGVKNPNLKFLFKNKYLTDENRIIVHIFEQIHDGPFQFQKEEVEWGKFVTISELEEMIKKEKFCPDGIDNFKKYLEEYHGK